MKFGNISYRESILLIVLLTISVTLVFAEMLVIPMQDRLEIAQEMLSQAEVLQHRTRYLMSQEETLLSQHKVFKSVSVKQNEIASAVDMVAAVHKIASNQIRFSSIRPSTLQKKSDERECFAVDLDCVSRFDQLVKFIYKVEKQNNNLSIKSMELSLSATRKDSVNVHLRLESIPR